MQCPDPSQRDLVDRRRGEVQAAARGRGAQVRAVRADGRESLPGRTELGPAQPAGGLRSERHRIDAMRCDNLNVYSVKLCQSYQYDSIYVG